VQDNLGTLRHTLLSQGLSKSDLSSVNSKLTKHQQRLNAVSPEAFPEDMYETAQMVASAKAAHQKRLSSPGTPSNPATQI